MADIIKTALVTGGAKRIGRAIVEDLAANGYAVAIHANNSHAEAEALAADIRAKGSQAAVVKADLRDVDATGSLLDGACGTLGPIGLLVNNASVFLRDSASDFDQETWDTHFALHVRTPAILTAALARQMPAGAQGLAVNIIDQRVWALTPNFFSYTLSKSALWTATQTMAQAHAPAVRVNAIGPGPALANERQHDGDFQRQVDGLLLKAGPVLAEFGRTIRYLHETPSITGQMIALDGGQHLAWETPDVADIAE